MTWIRIFTLPQSENIDVSLLSAYCAKGLLNQALKWKEAMPVQMMYAQHLIQKSYLGDIAHIRVDA